MRRPRGAQQTAEPEPVPPRKGPSGARPAHVLRRLRRHRRVRVDHELDETPPREPRRPGDPAVPARILAGGRVSGAEHPDGGHLPGETGHGDGGDRAHGGGDGHGVVVHRAGVDRCRVYAVLDGRHAVWDGMEAAKEGRDGSEKIGSYINPNKSIPLVTVSVLSLLICIPS